MKRAVDGKRAYAAPETEAERRSLRGLAAALELAAVWRDATSPLTWWTLDGPDELRELADGEKLLVVRDIDEANEVLQTFGTAFFG